MIHTTSTGTIIEFHTAGLDGWVVTNTSTGRTCLAWNDGDGVTIETPNGLTEWANTMREALELA